jgi:quercetin dioxygenase-like cupin family protein
MIMALASFQATAHEATVSKPEKKIIYQAPLAGTDGLEMTVAYVAVPAGFVGGKHLHPGPVFVYVLEGELTVELEGETKTFKAGELYPEDINAAMVGKNLSTTDDLKLLIFHTAGAGQPEKVAVN